MKYKEFPTKIWTEIEAALKEIQKLGLPAVAAFDADGTLWDIDLGESFFQYIIDRKLVPLPEDPWNFYLTLKAKDSDPRSAYLWLAQILENVSLEVTRSWANDCFMKLQPEPIFAEQKKLIHYLLAQNVKVYVVTASVKWAVEPGARFIGLNNEDVIGVETAVENGLITSRQKGIITYRSGKVEALKAVNPRAPFFTCGNTLGDENLLASATHYRLGVSAAARDDKLFRAERELADLCEEKGWPHHRFI